MKRICIYGKGGIGKSTISANLAAAYAEQGYKTALIGCDPKADSTRSIAGRRIDTILDIVVNKKEGQISVNGYKDILCMEAGGPSPGTGCAGRGIIVAMDKIKESALLQDKDKVIYDVLGDVVCGGFSSPLRENIADQVYIVTTSDFMSLYAANNICIGIAKYAKQGNAGLSGIIYNGRSAMGNIDMVKAFAERVGSKIVGSIPMSDYICKAELVRKTVIESFPGTEIYESFMDLAQNISENESSVIPGAMTYEEVEELCLSYL